MSEINEGIQLEELNCSVCQEIFGNNEKNPRILNCGHTFCTSCLNSLIHSRPYCPECRIKMNFRDVKSIPIAYIVKKIVESIDELNKLSLKSNSPSEPNKLVNGNELDVVFNDRSNPFPSVGTCTTHNAPQQFWCETCSKWICGTCAYIDHSNKEVEAFCLVLSASEHFDNLKMKEIKRLQNQTRELSQACTTIKNFIELILCQKKSMARSKFIEKEMNKILSMLHIRNDSLRETYEVLHYSNSIDQAETLRQLKHTSEFIDNLFSNESFPKTEEELIEGLWSDIFSKIPFILYKATYLFTSIRHDGLRHFSQMYICGNYLVVPTFFTRPADANFLIPYKEVRKNVKILKAFLKLSANGRNFGTIQILLLNNKRAHQFAMLCTGETGPSYKGSCFFSSKGLFTRFISGGDYETNSGNTGCAIIEPPYDVPDEKMQNGIVCGEPSHSKSTLAQFKIYYEVGSSPYARHPIGFVEHGLDIVKDIAKRESKQIWIQECGILIPLCTDDGSPCLL